MPEKVHFYLLPSLVAAVILTSASPTLAQAPAACDPTGSWSTCLGAKNGKVLVEQTKRTATEVVPASTSQAQRARVVANTAFCRDANADAVAGRSITPEVTALCRGFIGVAAGPGRGDVVRAFRELGLYRGDIRTEPRLWTLVHFETFFWCGTSDGRTCEAVGEGERRVTLLGQAVRIRPKIVGYSWDFGDGTTAEVTGRAAHTYEHAGDRTVTLTLTWTADYAVGTAAFQPIDDTTTTTSAPRLLPVREAQTVIVEG